MHYTFTSYGHPNITATHKTTIEFTKDKNLTKRGDCIVGVNSDFSLNKLKKIVRKNKKIKIVIQTDNLKEEINGILNPDFDDDKEMVIRKSDFISKRTFMIKADKACSDLNRELVNKLKCKGKVNLFLVITD